MLSTYKLYPGLLLLITLIILGCDEENEKLDCSLVDCPTPYLKVKFIDKTTGKDLLLDENSSFSTTDLKIFSSPFPEDVNLLSVDSSENVIVINHILSVDSISLASFPADKIDISTKIVPRNCCGLEVTELAVNDSIICKPCEELYSIVLVLEK